MSKEALERMTQDLAKQSVTTCYISLSLSSLFSDQYIGAKFCAGEVNKVNL